MKLLLALGLTAALAAALFFVPLAGRTLWQRAEERGLPQAAARATSSGVRAAVRWAESREPRPNPPDDMPGHRGPRREPARPSASSARAPAPEPHGAAIERPAAPPSPPAAAHDHIVAAPAKEALSPRDRQGLDRLIANAGRDR